MRDVEKKTPLTDCNRPLSIAARIVLVSTLILAITVPPVSAQEPLGYDPNVYQQLAAEMLEADEAREQTELESQEWLDATWTAIEVRQNLFSFFEAALDSGQMDEDTEQFARDARLLLVENIVTLLVSIGECDAGERVANLIGGLEEHEVDAYRRAYENAQVLVATCQPREALSETEPEATDPEPNLGEPGDDIPPSDDSDLGGIVLIGTGAAAILAGVIVDQITLSTHDDFIAARDRYTATRDLDDFTEAEELKNSVETDQVIAIALYGGGAALAVTGALMILLDSESTESQQSAWIPVLTSETVGVRVAF